MCVSDDDVNATTETSQLHISRFVSAMVLNVGFVTRVSRDTAANDESTAAVLFTNLLSQLERARAQEQNFLQRHNMKIIQQQLQVCHLLCLPLHETVGALDELYKQQTTVLQQ